MRWSATAQQGHCSPVSLGQDVRCLTQPLWTLWAREDYCLVSDNNNTIIMNSNNLANFVGFEVLTEETMMNIILDVTLCRLVVNFPGYSEGPYYLHLPTRRLCPIRNPAVSRQHAERQFGFICFVFVFSTFQSVLTVAMFAIVFPA